MNKKKFSVPYHRKSSQLHQYKSAAKQCEAEPTSPDSLSMSPTNANYKLNTVTLSTQQKQFFNLLFEKQNIFLTGAAGTGKSHILTILQEIFKRIGHTDKVAITASTGVAACNIGGSTIHSWAGVGQGFKSADDLYTQVIH
jgi:ATP-dependent DNA helicase PIF1